MGEMNTATNGVKLTSWIESNANASANYPGYVSPPEPNASKPTNDSRTSLD